MNASSFDKIGGQNKLSKQECFANLNSHSNKMIKYVVETAHGYKLVLTDMISMTNMFSLVQFKEHAIVRMNTVENTRWKHNRSKYDNLSSMNHKSCTCNVK